MRALLMCAALVGCLGAPGHACPESTPEPWMVRRVATGAGDRQGERLFGRVLQRRQILEDRRPATDPGRWTEPAPLDPAAWLTGRWHDNSGDKAP